MDRLIELLETNMPGMVMWAWWVVVGQILAAHVFTVDRATRNGQRRGPWHWARELLPLGIIIAGALVGLVWTDPLEQGWPMSRSVAYFAAAAIASLPVVHIARARGYTHLTPVDTYRPPRQD